MPGFRLFRLYWRPGCPGHVASHFMRQSLMIEVFWHRRDAARKQSEVFWHRRDAARKQSEVFWHRRDAARKQSKVFGHRRGAARKQSEVFRHRRDAARKQSEATLVLICYLRLQKCMHFRRTRALRKTPMQPSGSTLSDDLIPLHLRTPSISLVVSTRV